MEKKPVALDLNQFADILAKKLKKKIKRKRKKRFNVIDLTSQHAKISKTAYNKLNEQRQQLLEKKLMTVEERHRAGLLNSGDHTIDQRRIPYRQQVLYGTGSFNQLGDRFDAGISADKKIKDLETQLQEVILLDTPLKHSGIHIKKELRTPIHEEVPAIHINEEVPAMKKNGERWRRDERGRFRMRTDTAVELSPTYRKRLDDQRQLNLSEMFADEETGDARKDIRALSND